MQPAVYTWGVLPASSTGLKMVFTLIWGVCKPVAHSPPPTSAALLLARISPLCCLSLILPILHPPPRAHPPYHPPSLVAARRFQQWAFGDGGMREIWSNLPAQGQQLFPLLRSTSDLLMMPKDLLLEEGIRADMCSSVSTDCATSM